MSLFLFVFASLLYLPIGYAEPAQDFFNDSYDKAKQIFAIGESNHISLTSYRYLSRLLNKRGIDPDLRFIIIERAHDQDEFYKTISTSSNGDPRKLNSTFWNLLKAQEHPLQLLGIGEEYMAADPFLITEIIPQIQELNRRRLGLGFMPIELRSVDGLTRFSNFDQAKVSEQLAHSNVLDLQSRISHLNLRFSDEKPVCLTNGSMRALLKSSMNREINTANHFKSIFKQALDDEERAKIIILYHIGHLMPGVKGILPFDENQKSNQWTFEERPYANWIGLLIHEKLFNRKDIRVVLLDEASAIGSQDGVLNLRRFNIQRDVRHDIGFSLENVPQNDVEPTFFSENCCLAFRLYNEPATPIDIADDVIVVRQRRNRNPMDLFKFWKSNFHYYRNNRILKRIKEISDQTGCEKDELSQDMLTVLDPERFKIKKRKITVD